MFAINIPHLIKAETYYSACEKIDRQNRCRQEILDIRKKLGTKYWSKGFNLSIFAMNVVDVWLAYQCINGTEDTQASFYNNIAEEMIDTT